MQSAEFLRSARHPTLGRGYLETAYAPMIELLGFLAANGFSNYTASGGGRDFMRPMSQQIYGIPRERVIGSSTTLAYTGDDRGGPSHTRRKWTTSTTAPENPYGSGAAPGDGPLLAAGNSNGDIPMLDFTPHARKPFLRLLLLHDDPDREFDYTSGAETALERARVSGWTSSG